MKIIKEKELLEMARIGFTNDGYEIYIHTDDPGNVPHFHYWDSSTKGQNFHTCIRIDEPNYFHHTGKEDVLNTKQKKELVEFLISSPKSKRYDTNWEMVVEMWNINNSDVEISTEQTMPDYFLL